MASRERLSKQEWTERTAAKVALAQETLAAEVTALQSGEDWQRYLAFQARLHIYSPNNVMLIFAQHAFAYGEGRVGAPEPTYVAGFHTWRALGRSVDKGQHGYAVLAPCRYERQIAVGPDGKARRLSVGEAPGDGEKIERRNVLGGFRIEHVFDVSQTSGAEVPEPVRPKLLEGQAPQGLGASVLATIEDAGYRVDTVASAAAIGGANGQTDRGQRIVLVRSDMDEAAMVKTLIHEAAHVLLHTDPPGMYLPRPLKEVEAESVAYVVASAHGMPTGDYSFPYVASWAGENVAKAVQATQLRVREDCPPDHRVELGSSHWRRQGAGCGGGDQCRPGETGRARSPAGCHTRRRAGHGGGVMPGYPQAPTETPPTLTLVRFPDPVVERFGHRPGSPYVEFVWLGILGPSTTFAWQRLARQAAAIPSTKIDITDLSVSLGLGESLARNATMSRTLARLVAFDGARRQGDTLAVRLALPDVPERRLTRLSYSARLAHERFAHGARSVAVTGASIEPAMAVGL